MMPVTPPKLQPGDRVHVIAPSRSMAAICQSDTEKESHARAIACLEAMGLRVTQGAHIWDSDPFDCPPRAKRLEDLHEAFRDPDISAIITVIGGWNGNQILDDIDYELVAKNPKIFCGYSDISVFHGAFLKKANLVTYYGPHISTFGMKLGIDYTIAGFKQALMSEAPYHIEASSQWADDPWFIDQDTRHFIDNSGYEVLQPGDAEGHILGGNLCTMHLLQGTPYASNLSDCLLFVEDLRDVREFDRLLQSLLQSPGGSAIGGLVIGRFPKAAKASSAWLTHLVKTKPSLKGKPVIYGVDFGHTTPHTTFPIGGQARIRAGAGVASIEIIRH